MNRKEIENKFRRMVSKNVPDVLDEVLTQCEEKKDFKEVRIMKKEIKEKRFNFMNTKVATAVLALVIALGAVVGVNYYESYQIDSVIDFDVNPSIEIMTNKKEEVIKANAKNDEGGKILEGMDLEKVQLDVAVNAIIGSMLKNGYITELQNSVLISVKNEDLDRAKELEKRVTDEINKVLGEKQINGAVLSQRYDDSLEDLSNKHNISSGKANLINKVLEAKIKDSNGMEYQFATLAKLSINELNVLLNSKEVKLEEVNTTGTSNTKGYITRDDAKKIALEKAGVSESKTFEMEIEMDTDDGFLYYEVEFKTSTHEYEYDINAEDGRVMEFDVEKLDKDEIPSNTTNNNSNNNSSNNNQSGTTKYIGKTKAKEIALNKAGLTAARVFDLEVDMDTDEKLVHYEVEFKTSTHEYEYEIDAITGKIIKSDVEKNDEDDD